MIAQDTYHELDGVVPVGSERRVKASCGNCLHPEMKERDYIHIATAEETTLQTCPVCGCIRTV